MRRISISLVVIAVAMCLFTVQDEVASATSNLRTCQPSSLTVTAGRWGYEIGSAGTSEAWLNISVKNKGVSCVFGGAPRIIPVGVSNTQVDVGRKLLAALVSGPKLPLMKIEQGRSAYTYLRFEYQSSPKAVAQKWASKCKAENASGFSFEVGPVGHVLKREFKIALPVVCTSGKLNDLTTKYLGPSRLF